MSKVYAYDISNGQQKWQVAINDGVLSDVAIDNNKQVYVTSQKALNIIDSSNGLLAWTYLINSSSIIGINSTPTIDSSNNVCFGGFDGSYNYIYSINCATRTFNWKYKTLFGGAIKNIPMISNNQNIYFDTDYKFVVDFDFYIQYLRSNKFKYIDSILIHVGFNEDQITKYTFNVSKVQIPENISFLNKHGNLILRNIFVYDYYWRLFRNLRIRSIQDVLSYEGLVVSDQIIELLKFQIKITLKILTYGIMSKFFMLYSYIMKLRLKL